MAKMVQPCKVSCNLKCYQTLFNNSLALEKCLQHDYIILTALHLDNTKLLKISNSGNNLKKNIYLFLS